jgi:lipid A 3-O-deacylase
MKNWRLISALTLAVSGAFAGTAQARVDELRIGVVQHNIRTEDGDLKSPKEGGPNIEGEVVFKSPDMFKIVGSPRPYLMASVNTQGETSFAAIGVYWRLALGPKWAFEPGFGYAVHDGENDIPLGLSPAQREAFKAQHQLLGSRDLFRTSFALEREINPRFSTQLYYEHLSHGEVLGHGRNQGLDEAGLRFIIRFTDDPSN